MRKPLPHDDPASLGPTGGRLATATIMFHAAAADALGLSLTEARCRHTLLRYGALSAGELATHLGLTTGAVTGLIDRLTRHKLVRRVADPADLRRVVVEPVVNAALERKETKLLDPLRQRVQSLGAALTAQERAAVGKFLGQVCLALEEETVRVRATQLR